MVQYRKEIMLQYRQETRHNIEGIIQTFVGEFSRPMQHDFFFAEKFLNIFTSDAT